MGKYQMKFSMCLFWAMLLSGSVCWADSLTYSRDVAKVIHEKCSACHRPNSSGPFSLLTFEDVRTHSGTIKAVLEDDYMPPWKPKDHGVVFANNRALTSAEKTQLIQWIDAGCPEGDPAETPSPPAYPDGWTLGKPDMVVRMNGQYEVPADGPDIYRSFVFQLDLPEDKWVKAVELRPQAKSSVHHAIFFVDTNLVARTIDGADGKVGIEGMSFLTSFGGSSSKDNEPNQRQLGRSLLDRFRGKRSNGESDVSRTSEQLNRGLGGYVPGATPNLLPGDLAMSLPKGSDIVMQTHFHPSGKREIEQAELALYFADRPPSRPIVPVMIPAMFGFGAKLKVPAGKNDHRMSDSITLPVDTQAIGVSGHAHYICRKMKLTATRPNGQSTILLDIDDWDLDWQDQYLFEQPIDLPAGTVLETELIYDNSSENPENPFDPPREIRWGRGSTDEMGSVTLMTTARFKRDNAMLEATIRQHVVESLVDRSTEDLVEMLMQLDNNHDGKLDPSETPPRFNRRMLKLLDRNNDGGLQKEELMPMIKLRDLPFFQGQRNSAAPQP
ncbi:MAG: hypothetical protein AAGG48_27285 [Planctomycetota bacterium]